MPARANEDNLEGRPRLLSGKPVLLPKTPARNAISQAMDEALRDRLNQLTNDTFLSFATLGDEVSIWTADNRGMQFHSATVSRKEIMELCEELLNLLRDPAGSDVWVDSVSRRLYEALFTPVEALLERSRNLVVHFSDDMNFIPLAVLKTARGEYLLDRLSFLTTSTFPWKPRDAPNRLIRPESKLLLVDACDFSASGSTTTPRFAEPDEELFFVASLLPYNDMLSKDSATPQQLLRLAPNADVVHCRSVVTADREGPVLHLSAQAKPPRSPRKPGGIEGQLRLAALPRGVFGQCELLFLDANYRNRRQHDSPSLWRETSRAFHYAGVHNLILPLWNTPQPVRAEYTRYFYRNVQAGIALDEAMRQAAIHVRAIPGWSHPHYWASYVHSTAQQ